jgi:diacylglycerol kinase (ATP)
MNGASNSIAKNIAILCNQLAGAGGAPLLGERIALQLSGKQILHSIFIENWPDHFNEFTDVWIVGGDGTLNYFVNHYPDIKLPLVIFNGGTGNDFHWLLYGKINFEEQLQLVLSADQRPIDLGRCNEKFFINEVGIGFEGEVARSLSGKKKKAGKTSYMIMIIRKIFSYRSSAYRIMADDKPIVSKKYLMVDICNGSRAGGSFHIAPQSKADDGLFDIVLIDAIHPLKRLRWSPVIEKGKYAGLSFVNISRAKKITIESNSIIQSHLDGEYYSADKLEIEILPGKLLFRY